MGVCSFGDSHSRCRNRRPAARRDRGNSRRAFFGADPPDAEHPLDHDPARRSLCAGGWDECFRSGIGNRRGYRHATPALGAMPQSRSGPAQRRPPASGRRIRRRGSRPERSSPAGCSWSAARGLVPLSARPGTYPHDSAAGGP